MHDREPHSLTLPDARRLSSSRVLLSIVAKVRSAGLGARLTSTRVGHLRWTLAVLAVGLAWASRERFFAEAGDRSPFFAFSLAVLITALAGGFGPGLLATILSATIAVFFYLPPHLAFAVDAPIDVVQLGLFGLEGIVAAIAGGIVRRAVIHEEAMNRSAMRFVRFLHRTEVVRGRRLVAAERLIEGLTEREREVARLLALGLSNSEIASTLFVSRNTIKTHLKHIYEKLAVRTRTEAVARCIELGLLSGSPGEDEARAALPAAVVDARPRPWGRAA